MVCFIFILGTHKCKWIRCAWLRFIEYHGVFRNKNDSFTICSNQWSRTWAWSTFAFLCVFRELIDVSTTKRTLLYSTLYVFQKRHLTFSPMVNWEWNPYIVHTPNWWNPHLHFRLWAPWSDDIANCPAEISSNSCTHMLKTFVNLRTVLNEDATELTIFSHMRSNCFPGTFYRWIISIFFTFQIP